MLICVEIRQPLFKVFQDAFVLFDHYEHGNVERIQSESECIQKISTEILFPRCENAGCSSGVYEAHTNCTVLSNLGQKSRAVEANEAFVKTFLGLSAKGL